MKDERGNFGKALIFAVLFATLAFVSIGCASAATIYVPDDYAKIQWAIDKATAGETIMVNAFGGPYYENVVVNQQLTLIGIGFPEVNASGIGSAITVRADGCLVRGFNATGGGDGWRDAGIKVESDNNVIQNNTNSNNRHGIFLYSSSNNNITNNTADSNTNCGIYLHSSSNNTITNNNASYNNEGGIVLDGSSNNNTITHNTASYNRWNGIIYLRYSSNNTITNNNAYNNKYGIYLSYSSSNTITNNTVSNNNYGIYLGYSSNNNILTNNTANSNNWYDIYLYSSCNGNLIYNNYFNSTNNAWDNGNNTWNITKTLGTNIIGGPYLGGNYWSGYPGEDLDGDGLGDTMLPYNSSGNIANGGDYQPLTMPAPDATVSISPSIKNVSPGPFTVNVTVEPEVPIAGVQFDLSFNPSLVRANNVTEGHLLKQGGANTFFYSGTIDNAAGTITYAASAITTPGETVSTPGVLATIQMTAKSAAGTSTLGLSNVIAGDMSGNAVAITVNDGSVTISTADVNGDGFVNVLDMILVGQHFGETGAPGWIPEDVNCDGVIDVRDMLP